jgi:hypothetical protein
MDSTKQSGKAGARRNKQMAELSQAIPSQVPKEETVLAARPTLLSGKELSRWQRKLLPFMMYMVLGLTIFFFLASLVQLLFLHGRIWEGTKVGSQAFPEVLPRLEQATSEDMLAAGRIDTLASLELYLLERRYHQANVALMARVWVRYLGFVTGMALALVGATFILGKLREPPSEVSGEFAGGKLSFAGASPGILLVVVGVALMLTTIVTHHRIEVIDQPVFLQADQLYETRLSLPPSAHETPIEPTSTPPAWPETPTQDTDRASP